MLTVRTIKELITSCRQAHITNIPLIFKWIERCSSIKSTEEHFKLELYNILLSLKNEACKGGFIDRNTGEIIDSIYDDTTSIIFKNKNFWFTGRAFYGSRKKCEEAVSARGEISLENKKPEYLVIGMFAASLFGKEYYSSKVESALWLKTNRLVKSTPFIIHVSLDEKVPSHAEFREEETFIKGYPVSIISEDRWLKSL